MNPNTPGYIPSPSYKDKIKPPILTFGLVVVGVSLLTLSIFLIIVSSSLHLGLLPIATSIIGFIATGLGVVYFFTRRAGISHAKKAEEAKFSSWIEEKYGIVLTGEHLEQLYEYNTVNIDGVQYFLYYNVEGDNVVGYLLTDKDMAEEAAATGLIQVIEPEYVIETTAETEPDTGEKPAETT